MPTYNQVLLVVWKRNKLNTIISTYFYSFSSAVQYHEYPLLSIAQSNYMNDYTYALY